MTKTINNQTKYTAFTIIISVLMIFVLVGLSLRVILLPPFTAVIADLTVNDSMSALSHDGLVQIAKDGRDFVDSSPGASLPVGVDEKTSFSQGMVDHMQDVRDVFLVALFVTFGVLIATVALTVFVYKKKSKLAAAHGLFFGGIFAIVVVMLLVLLGIVNFESLFAGMHQLFFADGTWTFAEDSLLICAYPLSFWIMMAGLWALSLVLLSTISSIVGLVLKRRAFPKKIKSTKSKSKS